MPKCVLMHFIISVFKLKLNCRLYTECICLAMQDIVYILLHNICAILLLKFSVPSFVSNHDLLRA